MSSPDPNTQPDSNDRSREQIGKIHKHLARVGVPSDCPVCRHQTIWITLEAQTEALKNEGGDPPVFYWDFLALVCGRCGFTRKHALPLLDYLIKAFEDETTQSDVERS